MHFALFTKNIFVLYVDFWRSAVYNMYKITGQVYKTKDEAKEALKKLPDGVAAFVTEIYKWFSEEEINNDTIID